MHLNMSTLIAWLWETYDAKNIVGGRIGAKEWRNAAFDTLVQAAMQSEGCTKEYAETWLAEEVTEYYASKG